MFELENMQNDNSNMYEVVKKSNAKNIYLRLLIKGKDGLTANPTEKRKTFYRNTQPIRNIPPTQMAITFTVDEIWKLIAKVKPNKSPGCD